MITSWYYFVHQYLMMKCEKFYDFIRSGSRDIYNQSFTQSSPWLIKKIPPEESCSIIFMLWWRSPALLWYANGLCVNEMVYRRHKQEEKLVTVRGKLNKLLEVCKKLSQKVNNNNNKEYFINLSMFSFMLISYWTFCLLINVRFINKAQF